MPLVGVGIGVAHAQIVVQIPKIHGLGRTDALSLLLAVVLALLSAASVVPACSSGID